MVIGTLGPRHTLIYKNMKNMSQDLNVIKIIQIYMAIV